MNTINNQSQPFQEKASPRAEYKEPILRRLAIVAHSYHIIDGVVGNMERDLPGYTKMPDVAGAFISAYVKGPVETPQTEMKLKSEPSLPPVILTRSEIEHYVRVGSHYTIQETEERLKQRYAAVGLENNPVLPSDEVLAPEVVHDMKDIYELLDQHSPDAAVDTDRTSYEAATSSDELDAKLDEFLEDSKEYV
ncbi:MAG: hypothetical protein M3Q14_00265 [bacterium]|nr:hypothetical protein [bacterium]